MLGFFEFIEEWNRLDIRNNSNCGIRGESDVGRQGFVGNVVGKGACTCGKEGKEGDGRTQSHHTGRNAKVANKQKGGDVLSLLPLIQKERWLPT
jgi:hypothetical protein